MTASGVMDVLHHPDLVEAMHHLGYPTHILTLLGIAKFLAVAAIVAPGLPRVKEWAYAGLAIDLIGALWSHILVEDPPAQYAVIYLFLGLVIASHMLRPPSRKLLAA